MAYKQKPMENKLVIAIDFDSTLAVEEYPDIGVAIDGAVDVANWLYDKGHTIIIWTCREDEYATDAMEWLEMNGFKYHYFNENCPERIDKYSKDSRKIGCDVLIDDRCIFSKMMGREVDWSLVREAFNAMFDYE